MAGERRWSDRNARPSGCVVVLLAGLAALLPIAYATVQVVT